MRVDNCILNFAQMKLVVHVVPVQPANRAGTRIHLNVCREDIWTYVIWTTQIERMPMF